jgi:hypothetical protein
MHRENFLHGRKAILFRGNRDQGDLFGIAL